MLRIRNAAWCDDLDISEFNDGKNDCVSMKLRYSPCEVEVYFYKTKTQDIIDALQKILASQLEG